MVIIGLGNGLVPDCIKPLPKAMLTHPLPLEKNGHHFADYIFRCTFIHEMFCILIEISLMFVAKSPIGNNRALV